MTEMTTIVNHENAIDFTLRLEEISQLFTAPDLDPFAVQARVTSGIEDIVNHLHTQRLRKPPKISTTLVLPKDQLTPTLEQETRDAVARYADYQIEQARTLPGRQPLRGPQQAAVGAVRAGDHVCTGVSIACAPARCHQRYRRHPHADRLRRDLGGHLESGRGPAL